MPTTIVFSISIATFLYNLWVIHSMRRTMYRGMHTRVGVGTIVCIPTQHTRVAYAYADRKYAYKLHLLDMHTYAHTRQPTVCKNHPLFTTALVRVCEEDGEIHLHLPEILVRFHQET